MNATFAARFPFEVLHDVSDIDSRSIYSGLLQSIIEQFAGRSDKRLPIKSSSLPVLADKLILPSVAVLRQRQFASRASRDRRLTVAAASCKEARSLSPE